MLVKSMTPGVESSISFCLSSSGESRGWRERRMAATPLTRGVDILVPLSI